MRRHNGLPSSCEPCRRSKLRCDHAVPTCGRCLRKGKAATCVYKPNPTRIQAAAAAPTPTPTPFTPASLQSFPPASSSSSSAAAALASPLLPVQTPTPPVQTASGPRPRADPIFALRDRYIADWSPRLALNSTPSFLGLTSYSAVYSEASLRQHESITPQAQNVVFSVDDREAQLGAELLSLLFDDFAVHRKTAVAAEEYSGECMMSLPTIATIIDRVEGMYNNEATRHPDPQLRMLALSRRLFEGTSRKIVVHPTLTLDEYLTAIAGRWEAIGFIFTMSGICASHTTVEDPIFQGLGFSATDHKHLGILATAASDRCLQFCDNAGVMSDPLGWLLLRHVHLLTLVCGDYDYRPRKRLGELSTLLFALGYHQPDTNEEIPFFLSEGRKKLMASVYICDKELATFLGCPPLIAWRFCRLQSPLDLDVDDLLAEPAVREAAIRNLTHDGWNTKGTIKRTSWIRMSMKLGYIRELVLELSLDSRVQDLSQKAHEISTLTQKVRSEIPVHLQWNEGTDAALRLTSTIPVYIHLDLLYSQFLLQRVLVKRLETGSENLVNLAHEMLKAILVLIAVSQRCGNPLCDLGWSIPYFGLPSAGILAIELLRQTQNPRPRPGETPFPRSEVIRNLSILASHMQYLVLPQKGNYEICQQGRKVISHILDLVLAPRPDPTSLASAVPDNNLIPADWLNDEWLNDGTDFIKWIDGLNWMSE
ncbi:hypothetical protein ASPZODRAFT_131731 [Penicilliopsis zonata CBS 506.65]|uniref:Zn(2)-C6 fungal-type domain-containing protein n=1 Tax=Penicilliopsis zonata CBS 506.65 TaxID=1073090 RepID=A0A1L9SHZ0_9EURO|nr:hypothetical protein ASPZODRAFT_131731 [Penicilliopsis zonata CBS 506.65]OJJ46840.1 hypothetical protein ASPZODRAFT_131731 [Penicilliopsis zonata CBS 506.65]